MNANMFNQKYAQTAQQTKPILLLSPHQACWAGAQAHDSSRQGKAAASQAKQTTEQPVYYWPSHTSRQQPQGAIPLRCAACPACHMQAPHKAHTVFHAVSFYTPVSIPWVHAYHAGRGCLGWRLRQLPRSSTSGCGASRAALEAQPGSLITPCRCGAWFSLPACTHAALGRVGAAAAFGQGGPWCCVCVPTCGPSRASYTQRRLPSSC